MINLFKILLRLSMVVVLASTLMTVTACGGGGGGGDDGPSEVVTDGDTDGDIDGSADGAADGSIDGDVDGAADGSDDGAADGSADGAEDGAADGAADGSEDGAADGAEDGAADGAEDGAADGAEDGAADGAEDGAADGAEDGAADGAEDGDEDGAADGSTDGDDDQTDSQFEKGKQLMSAIFWSSYDTSSLTQAEDSDKDIIPTLAVDYANEEGDLVRSTLADDNCFEVEDNYDGDSTGSATICQVTSSVNMTAEDYPLQYSIEFENVRGGITFGEYLLIGGLVLPITEDTVFDSNVLDNGNAIFGLYFVENYLRYKIDYVDYVTKLINNEDYPGLARIINGTYGEVYDFDAGSVTQNNDLSTDYCNGYSAEFECVEDYLPSLIFADMAKVISSSGLTISGTIQIGKDSPAYLVSTSSPLLFLEGDLFPDSGGTISLIKEESDNDSAYPAIVEIVPTSKENEVDMTIYLEDGSSLTRYYSWSL